MALPGTHGTAEWQGFYRIAVEDVMKLSASSGFLAVAELPALSEHSCFSELGIPLFTGPFLDMSKVHRGSGHLKLLCC